MMSLFRHAERYRCGVTMAGVSDLGLLFKSEEVRSTPGLRDLIAESVGDPEHDRELLNQLSPAFLARNGMPRPVFIAHGGKDARAEPEHAYRLRAAIEGAGGKVEWMFAPEAGHGFSKLKDQREFYGRLVAFLDAQLGR
jgi:dipeptidyl aminopeptidase/acylaminoacyl peptidase